LLLSLGPRVLRQETAVVVALGQVLGRFWKS
jgi:16S rRNA U1498 N3-methylase RsmE